MGKKLIKLSLFILLNILISGLIMFVNYGVPSFSQNKPLFFNNTKYTFVQEYFGNRGIPFTFITGAIEKNCTNTSYKNKGIIFKPSSVCMAEGYVRYPIIISLILDWFIFFIISFVIANMIRKKIKQKKINEKMSATVQKTSSAVKEKTKKFIDSF